MKVLGIDVGSLNTKTVILDGKSVIYRQKTRMAEKGEVIAKKAIAEALAACRLARGQIDSIVTTSHIKLETSFADLAKNFIVCFARGASSISPRARTIIDVGAENVSVVSLDNNGKIRDYARNDKCAAGSGVFLEAIAKMMGLTIEEMVAEALKADKGIPIASTCTVFAEQEVLSAVFEASPPSRREILAGVHDALASRVVGLAMNVGLTSPVLLSGGLANNGAFVASMKQQVDGELLIPENPEFISAIGAALMSN